MRQRLKVEMHRLQFSECPINSVSKVRNCRVITIQMKLVSTNYLFTAEKTEAASEVVLDVFTHSLMKPSRHKCIYTEIFYK